MLYICNTTKAQSSFSSEKTERPPKVQNFSCKLTITYDSINQQGKMIPYLLSLILICHISNVTTMDINLGDLPNNVLNLDKVLIINIWEKYHIHLIDFT